MSLKTILKEKLLIVEGKDEENFFNEFINIMSLNDIQIHSLEGTGSFRAKLGAVVDTNGFDNVKVLGIERDADEDPQATFISICDALREYGLPVPTECISPVNASRKVSVMVIPTQSDKGMLEDICLKSIENDHSFKCTENYFNCLIKSGIDINPDLSKRKVQAFLCSKPELVSCLGLAAKKGYWPFDDRAFDNIRKFLEVFR